MSPALTMFEVTPDHPVPISPQGGTASVTVLSGDTLYYADTPQVSAANNQGSVTAGNVQSFTNPAWVRSASLSTVLVQIAAPPTLPSAVPTANSPQGDPLGRTQVMGTSTIAAPSLRQFVTVMDGPWSAKGDGVTDDTTAANSAISAVSTAGGGIVRFPEGFTFLLGTITPKSNVTVWAYGASFKLVSSATFGLFSSGSSPVPVSNWRLRGGSFTGTGSETTFQNVFFCVQGTDVSCDDVTVNTWNTGPIYFNNCTRVHANFNTLVNVCTFTGTNAINLLIGGGTTDLAYNTAEAIGNHIDQCYAEGISVGETGNPHTGPVKCTIANNVVNTTSGIGGAGNTPINIEWSTLTPGEASRVIVANNHCTANVTSAAASGLAVTVSPSTNNDPYVLSKVVIAGNTVDSNQLGISVNSSDTLVTGNEVSCSGSGALRVAGSGRFSATGTTTNGSPSVTGVTASASIVNGSPITGTGIASGTYLVSGAGTATWTLSLPASGANAGLTVFSSIKNVSVTGNLFHQAASPSSHVIFWQGVRDSDFTGNRVVIDPGSTTAVDAFNAQQIGWINFVDNQVWNAPREGINLSGLNDFEVRGNRIYNPGESTSGVYGIQISGTSGKLARAVLNTIVDSRAAHQMAAGVNVVTQTTSPNTPVVVARNEIHGYTGTSSVVGTCAPGSVGNIDDQGTSTAPFITASNASWPIPAGATLLRVTVWGGGGQGGGAGSAATGIAQAGGAGGPSGTFTQAVVPLGASTTANVTVGAGGSGAGVGGAAGGNAGTAGGSGGFSSVVIGATTIRANPGRGGLGSAASSTAAVNGFIWGTESGNTSNNIGAGYGGPSGVNGGDPVGPVAGGGGGGGAATATNGGGGGGAGSYNNVTNTAGTAGASGTTSGLNGADAAANSGGGGGGGGGGTAGTGAGGNGGNGGSGGVIIEVLA